MLTSHPDRTQGRIDRLSAYLDSNVLKDHAFLCRHYRECLNSRDERYSFYPGQLHHVGRHFDLERDGHDLRIVIIAQEYGTPDVGFSLAERSKEVSEQIARVSFAHRNHHMKGTTSILRLLLGRDPGMDFAGERLFDVGEEAHIFEGFALIDAVMCSAIERTSNAGASPGYATGVMYRNCGNHLRETLRILDPTVIVVEGVGVRNYLPESLAESSLGGNVKRWPASEKIELLGHRTLMFNFVHPSAPGKYAWWGQGIDSPYLRQIVEPEIRKYFPRIS